MTGAGGLLPDSVMGGVEVVGDSRCFPWFDIPVVLKERCNAVSRHKEKTNFQTTVGLFLCHQRCVNDLC